MLSLKVSGHAETEEHATTPWNDSMNPDAADESRTSDDTPETRLEGESLAKGLIDGRNLRRRDGASKSR
jgi:hypothetical protein